MRRNSRDRLGAPELETKEGKKGEYCVFVETSTLNGMKYGYHVNGFLKRDIKMKIYVRRDIFPLGNYQSVEIRP